MLMVNRVEGQLLQQVDQVMGLDHEGAARRDVVEQNRGATGRTVDALLELVGTG